MPEDIKPGPPGESGVDEQPGNIAQPDNNTGQRAEPQPDSNDQAEYNQNDEKTEDSGPDTSEGSDTWLIEKAQQNYTTSTDYLDANITNTWEKNLSHFRSEHAPGSSYTQANFKRSAIFRPKTRTNLKAQEASFATSTFGSQDLLVIEPEDPSDPVQVASAKITKSALQYRMKKKMPWFLTVQGAYQNAKVYGVCFSHNYWNYQVDEHIKPAFNNFGEPETNDQGEALGFKDRVIRHDELVCDLVAPENFRFDPMADWRDPISSSPYIIYMKPVYIGDALEMMSTNDPKTGKPVWREHSMETMLATRRQSYDRTRQAREGMRRVDPADENYGNENSIVWAHMNILRLNGEDYVYWTMGTEIVLTGLQRLRETHPHLNVGERPFTMGYTSIETHRNYPAGDVELTSGLQEEINTLANQRMDNVKLVLNKRYFVKRGSQTDLDALIRNVPGGGVMMNDPEKDVQVVNTPDVTGSSYEEQDRLAAEMDDLGGGFSGSSMQNSNLGETKDATQRVDSKAAAVDDYGKTIFIQSWLNTTIGQLVRLVQMYETDEVILSLAAKDAELYERFGVNEVTDQLLRQSLTVNVDVGVGNTDPMRRVEKLLMGVREVSQLPGMMERMKVDSIADEIFANLGYKSSIKFVMSKEEFAEYQEAKGEQPPPLEHQAKMRELDIREADNKMRDVRETNSLAQDRETGTANRDSQSRSKSETDHQAGNLSRERMQHERDLEAARGGRELFKINKDFENKNNNPGS